MSINDTNNITLLNFDQSQLPPDTKILVLEDNIVDQTAISRAASKSGLKLDFHFVDSLEAMCDAERNTQFDLAILDYSLPDGTGLDAFHTLAHSPLNHKCATIMVASEAEITVAVTAMKAGCSDYIAKTDLTPAVLRRAMVNALSKAVLRAKVTDAGHKIVALRAALREHAEISASLIRPMMLRTLSQLSSLDVPAQQDGVAVAAQQLATMADTCRDILKMCETIERDGKLASESLALPTPE